jgi:NAD(P)-dependent dehydrogenase (short-subunit alcohol dehydrogenase family)
MLTGTTIPAFSSGRGAVITGGASGIGLATARQLAVFGMRICIADRDSDAIAKAAKELAGIARNGADDVLAVNMDVSSASDIERLAESAFGRFRDIALLMNNAAAFQGGGALSDPDGWRRILDVNVLGVLNGVQRIGNAMIERGKSGFIVNTGSKQGITSPPGTPHTIPAKQQ